MIPENLNIFVKIYNHKIDYTKLKLASVLVIFVNIKDSNELALLFTKRSSTLAEHPGQISFPGGAFEKKDLNLQETALRETEEEINLKRNNLTILGPLPYQDVKNRWRMYPFTAFCHNYSSINANQDEVEKIIIWPISDLLKKHKKGLHKLENFLDVCKYDLNGEILWGATAKVVSKILDKLFLI